MEQLDALQSLHQLVLLTAAKEHLPGDIINILELLGKADSIPFNQLYNLTEDFTDRYYMKVIKTLTCLLENSFHYRQLVLVNSARALKMPKALKKTLHQIPLIQNNTQPFSWIPIGLSLSPHQLLIILNAKGTKMTHTQEQNTPVITTLNWKTFQN